MKPFFDAHPGFFPNAQVAAYQQAAYPHLYPGHPHHHPGYQNPYQPWFSHAAQFSNQLTNFNWNHHHQQQQLQVQQAQQQQQHHHQQLQS